MEKVHEYKTKMGMFSYIVDKLTIQLKITNTNRTRNNTNIKKINYDDQEKNNKQYKDTNRRH